MAEDNQYNALTQLYGSYGDAQLHELALTIDDLTETAQQALTAELRRRGLALPAANVALEKGGLGDLGGPAPASFAADAPAECTFEFTDLEDALLAQSVLKSAGIESLVPSSEIGAVDTARVMVAPADAAAAGQILSRPNALGTLTAEEAEFVEPVCPECGVADPLLESVEPTNEWRCEGCGHVWSDAELA